MEESKDDDVICNISLELPSCGLKWPRANKDLSLMKDLSVKSNLNEFFEFFHQNSRKMIFILDFHAGECRKWTNAQLVDFEEFLKKEGYDLRNFIYVSTKSDSAAETRFSGCKAKNFIYDTNLGGTRSLFNGDLEYVREQLYRAIDSSEQPEGKTEVIYSLGCGCWCSSAIPKNLKAPSIFENGGGTI